MAFTKINAAGIGTTETVTVDGLTVINNESIGGNLTVTGNATISGVLTYEDVTNVDSVGLITARNGIVVGSGITLSKDGDIFATGITTVGKTVFLSGNNPNIRIDDSDTTNNGEITLDNTQLRIEVDEDDSTSSSAIKFRVDGSDQVTIDSSGDLTIKDKIIHSGDTNTAIRFPSADTFTVETGGSERLRITSAGSIGINTTSPNRRFTLYQDATTRMNLKSLANSTVGIEFGDPDDENIGYIVYDNSSDYLALGVNAGERVRISSGGQVRINTAGAPSADLHVGGTDAVLNALFQTSRSSGAYHKYALGASGADLGYIGSAQQLSSSGVASGFVFRSENHIEFCSGGSTERIRIDSLGRLFINKTTNRDKYFNGTYTGKLQVEGTDDTTRLTQLIHNSANASQHIFVLGKSRGGVGSYTSVQDGDYLGTISFQGADGDEMVDGARIEAQVNGSPGNDSMPTDLLFKTNTGGASPTERFRIREDGKFFFGNDTSNQDSNRYVFVGTKATSGGIVQGQLAVADNSSYNTTDNGGSIGFQAKYNSSGAYTQMASCGGLKANNTDGHYEGRFQIKVRNHNGNSVEYVNITPTSSQFINSLTTESELNMVRASGVPSAKYMDIGFLNNTFNIRRTSGGDGGHAVIMQMSSAGVISGDFNDTSDAKLKKNVETIADGAIEDIKKLRPVTFDWIDDTRNNNISGFIAQEVKEVLPNLVEGTEYDPTLNDEEAGTKGGIKSEGYSIHSVGVTAHLTKAVQELIAEVETLKAKVTALEG